MDFKDDDFITISALQHFTFCRRQWALIFLERLWEDNLLTTEGELLHEKAHDAYLAEKRKDVIVSFGMPVISSTLGIQGVCDIVEFTRDDNGVPLIGRRGKYSAAPVEYKRGKKRWDDADRVQMCAQALCLEEMLATQIDMGYIFHHATRRREEVPLDEGLKAKTKAAIDEIRMYTKRGHTPKAKPTKACESCSVNDLCLPKMFKVTGAKDYIKSYINKI